MQGFDHFQEYRFTYRSPEALKHERYMQLASAGPSVNEGTTRGNLCPIG